MDLIEPLGNVRMDALCMINVDLPIARVSRQNQFIILNFYQQSAQLYYLFISTYKGATKFCLNHHLKAGSTNITSLPIVSITSFCNNAWIER